ncbi:hypothetical protein BWI93_23570 [Siphonobacter sp. BAB-5385]|nr:hypothetical protein BWI93_23570 [Siphonobacter sp. BAB-5385]PMD90518.1 hypothetical protein BWI97_23930 [Siphonobacter sp. BAB-5405]
MKIWVLVYGSYGTPVLVERFIFCSYKGAEWSAINHHILLKKVSDTQIEEKWGENAAKIPIYGWVGFRVGKCMESNKKRS